MAKLVRLYDVTPSTVVPSEARGAVAPYWANEGGPYTPSIPTLRFDMNCAFQGGGGNK
jgi:hypothetical protein